MEHEVSIIFLHSKLESNRNKQEASTNKNWCDRFNGRKNVEC